MTSCSDIPFDGRKLYFEDSNCNGKYDGFKAEYKSPPESEGPKFTMYKYFFLPYEMTQKEINSDKNPNLAKARKIGGDGIFYFRDNCGANPSESNVNPKEDAN